jgi:hypothetical protein
MRSQALTCAVMCGLASAMPQLAVRRRAGGACRRAGQSASASSCWSTPGMRTGRCRTPTPSRETWHWALADLGTWCRCLCRACGRQCCRLGGWFYVMQKELADAILCYVRRFQSGKIAVDEAGVWVQGPTSRHISSQVIMLCWLPTYAAVLIANYAHTNSACVPSADCVAPLSAGQSAEREGERIARLTTVPLFISIFCVLASGTNSAKSDHYIISASHAVSSRQQASGQKDAVNSFREAEAAATETCPEAAQRASAPDFRSPQQLLQQVWHTACNAAPRQISLHLACKGRCSSAPAAGCLAATPVPWK